LRLSDIGSLPHSQSHKMILPIVADEKSPQIHQEMDLSPKWWARRDLNPGPRDYESPALTAELQARLEEQENMEPVVGFEPTT
jgi:hypothetical protein